MLKCFDFVYFAWMNAYERVHRCIGPVYNQEKWPESFLCYVTSLKKSSIGQFKAVKHKWQYSCGALPSESLCLLLPCFLLQAESFCNELALNRVDMSEITSRFNLHWSARGDVKVSAAMWEDRESVVWRKREKRGRVGGRKEGSINNTRTQFCRRFHRHLLPTNYFTQ